MPWQRITHLFTWMGCRIDVLKRTVCGYIWPSKGLARSSCSVMAFPNSGTPGGMAGDFPAPSRLANTQKSWCKEDEITSPAGKVQQFVTLAVTLRRRSYGMM